MALIPVSVYDVHGRALQPKDSLPIPGTHTRNAAVKAIQAFAKQVNGTCPNLECMLPPPKLFPCTGETLKRVQQASQTPSADFYVRIVDKVTGVLWGLCRHWVWQQVEEFLTKGGYQPVQGSANDFMLNVAYLVEELGWARSKRGKLCRVYIIGKAKSLWAGTGWLWRPIAASPSPIVGRSPLRVAVRAFTRFLKYLAVELPFSILRVRVIDLATWFHGAAGQGLHTVTQLDCKEQFNLVQLANVQQHKEQASAWLSAKRWWQMSEIVWSVHHMHSALDRAGKATASGFRYITHDRLCSIIAHELENNNACWAAGRVWVRTNCIPIGGPLSAQGADIHSLWQAYEHRSQFRQIGALTVSREGFPMWEGRWGRVAMCQFRDNILIATDSPHSKQVSLIQKIHDILKAAWGLEVECDCITPQQAQRTGHCYAPVRKAMGVVMTLHPAGEGCAFVEPAALNPDWSLRLQAP